MQGYVQPPDDPVTVSYLLEFSTELKVCLLPDIEYLPDFALPFQAVVGQQLLPLSTLEGQGEPDTLSEPLQGI